VLFTFLLFMAQMACAEPAWLHALADRLGEVSPLCQSKRPALSAKRFSNWYGANVSFVPTNPMVAHAFIRLPSSDFRL